MNKSYEKKEKKIKNKTMINPQSNLLKNLIQTNIHLGKDIKVTHPNNIKYLFGIRSDQTILNLQYTIHSIKRALLVIKKTLKLRETPTKKHKILIICNDLQTKIFSHEFKKLSSKIVILNSNWVGGLFTNEKILRSQYNDVRLIVAFNPIRDNLLIKAVKIAQIPLISVINTDTDSSLINYPILINTTNIKAIVFLINLFLTTIKYEIK